MLSCLQKETANRHDFNACQNEKGATANAVAPDGKSRPIGRILLRQRLGLCYDSHSSRRRITPALKLPTRTLRGPPHCVPIWNCTRWRLPRFTVTEYARLCGPVPRLIPCGFQRTAVSRHPALRCPDLPPVTSVTGGCLACFAAIVPRPARSWLSCSPPTS